MGDNELELAIEIGTGVLPGGKFSAKLRHTWEARASTFATQICEESGMSLEQIESVVLKSERLADVVANASERIVRVSDAHYRSALGRLVAAALSGDVTIDRAEELIDQLLTLDATTIRVLEVTYRGVGEAAARRQAVSLERVVLQAGITEDESSVAFARLAALGMVERSIEVETTVPDKNDEFSETEVHMAYDSTEWGRWAYRVCLSHLDVAGEQQGS